MSSLPTGTVTFLFTDIEGSTRLLGHLGERYPQVLEDHHRLLREAVSAHGGVAFGTEGDALFAAFPQAVDAVGAAVEAQRALAGHPWPEGGEVRVRMGLHTGEGKLGSGSYVGLDVHRTARIAAAGHGGQVLISDATHSLVERALPTGVSTKDLGEHRLKDLEHPERLRQLVIADLPSEFPEVRTLDARPGNLPQQLTSFVGRETEVAEVMETLAQARLLTLTGPGGTGKTRLSLAVAERIRDRFSDGAFFVPLASIADPKLVPTSIREALGLREEAGRQPLETVIDHLRERELLLVLDNFEQIVEAGSFVAEILGATEGVRVLVSSREALNLHGEHEFPVPPLALPDVHHLPPLETLSQFAAVRLFVQRAEAVKPSFRVTNENAPAVAEICARLDGLPLAIELAAARVKLLSPEDILKRLENRLELLSGGARDLPARQRTLRGAIAWSYDLLEPDEQRLFSRLAVFVGGFTLEAAEAVCSRDLALDVFDGLASMVNKSLVRQIETAGGARFFLLQTIAEFAAERAADEPEGEATRAAHARYFLDLAERYAEDVMGPRQPEVLDALAREHDNIRAALGWCVGEGEVSMAMRIAAAIWRFWQMRGHLREAAARFDELLALSGADDGARAAALEAAGGVFYWMAAWDRAEECYDESLALYRRIGDERKIAKAVYNLSFLFSVPPPPRRDVDRARVLREEALEIHRKLNDRRGIAEVSWALAGIHETTRDWQISVDLAEEALAIFRELGDRFGVGWALHSVGLGHVALGNHEQAEPALREALELFREAKDQTGVALLLADTAALRAGEGDIGTALVLREAAFEAERASGQALVSNQEHYFDWFGPSGVSEEQTEAARAKAAALSIDEAVALALGEEPGDGPSAGLSG